MAEIKLTEDEALRIHWGFTPEGKRAADKFYQERRKELGFPEFVPIKPAGLSKKEQVR